MAQPSSCRSCGSPYAIGNHYCARCGRGLIPTPESFWRRYRSYIAITGVVIVVFTAAVRSTLHKKPISEKMARQSATEDSGDNLKAVANFRKKLLDLPEANRLLLSVESAPVDGVVRIQVSNLWFNFKPFQKRQVTQMIANAWAVELPGKTTIVHVYDVTGREIAGTKAFGGVWVEDE